MNLNIIFTYTFTKQVEISKLLILYLKIYHFIKLKNSFEVFHRLSKKSLSITFMD